MASGIAGADGKARAGKQAALPLRRVPVPGIPSSVVWLQAPAGNRSLARSPAVIPGPSRCGESGARCGAGAAGWGPQVWPELQTQAALEEEPQPGAGHSATRVSPGRGQRLRGSLRRPRVQRTASRFPPNWPAARPPSPALLCSRDGLAVLVPSGLRTGPGGGSVGHPGRGEGEVLGRSLPQTAGRQASLCCWGLEPREEERWGTRCWWCGALRSPVLSW